MTAEIKKIEEILGASFSMDNYVSLIGEIFSSVKTISPYKQQKEYSNFSSHIVGYSHVANYTTPDEKKLIILAIELQKDAYVETSRSTQRSYAKKLIESSNSDAAVVAFYTTGETKWRLSFVRLDYEMKFENGKLKAVENITPARRYSFLVGEDEPSHTAIERLHSFIADKNSQPTLDELEEVFSVEKVTKEFFDLYCEKYHELREHLLTNEDFLAESEKCGFTAEQFAKKLMGQIVFLYFLQKKGWLGVGVWPTELTEKEYNNVFYTKGAQRRLIQEYLPQVYLKKGDRFVLRSSALDVIPDDAEEMIANNLPKDESKNWGTGSKKFLRTLFDYSKRRSGNFFNDYLEPLFYNTLNKNRGAMGYSPLLHCRIPFLSGGLFEPINGYQWEVSNFNIPDHIFSNKTGDDDRTADGILDIFDRYNFTMSEDEPMEREVAIDPEMLGKVFENLLDVTDRKSKGAFYTPREIVHYMCQESLINYLVNATGIAEDGIRDLILYGDFMKDEDTVKTIRTVDDNGRIHMKFDYSKDMYISEEILSFKNNVNRLNDIDHALADIRVADPAVGSGAFPLGMLNEIVRARQCLTEYMAIVVAKSAVSEAQASFFIRELRRDRTAYDLKRYTIKNSIFAVDIEPSAVDIARLRLWLSLVIDDEINPEANIDMLDGHRNPLPLPNLECNIICGNSLIDEFEGVSLLNQSDILGIKLDAGQQNLASNSFEAALPKLLKAQDDLFYCSDPAKKAQLIEQISALKDRAIEPQLYAMSTESRNRYEVTKKSASPPFVLWQLDFARVFRDKGGFDVVIGNPPYIGESGHKELFRKIASTGFGKRCYQGKMDYFYFFFHKGLDLLHDTGDLAFITTNYYPTATGAKKLRCDFRSRAQIRVMINFNEVRVFESALGQHNMITMLTKNHRIQVSCRSVVCVESLTATSDKIKQILYGKDKQNQVYIVAQENLFEGSEAYIRQAGVSASSENSIGSVIDKMAGCNLRLGQLAEVNQGVVSGCDYVSNRNITDISKDEDVVLKDGIFVLDLTNSRDLGIYNKLSSEEKRLCRPFFKNSEIERYCCNLQNTKVLIYINKKITSLANYPLIEKHLKRFDKVLNRRREAQSGAIKPFQLQWSRTEEIFMGRKIVVPYRTRENAFAYNDVEWFCRSDAYVITAKSPETDLFYLLGVLNSKLNYVWLYNRGKRKGDVLELFQVPLSEIPIISMSKEKEAEIAKLAQEITNIKQENKKADTKKFETRIDQILYQEYHLNEEEIALVEENAK